MNSPASSVSSAVSIAQQCSLCSAHFQKPEQNFPRPLVNNLICRILKIEPPTLPDGSSYLNQFVPICTECSVQVKAYDKKRIELDVLGQEIVSSVLGTLLQIRPYDKTPLDPVKNIILDQWGRGKRSTSIRGKQLPYGDVLTPPRQSRPSQHQSSPRVADLKRSIDHAPQLKGKSDSSGSPVSDHDQKIQTSPEVGANVTIDCSSQNSLQENTNDHEDDEDNYGGRNEIEGRSTPGNFDTGDGDEEWVESDSNRSDEDDDDDDDECVTKKRKLIKAVRTGGKASETIIPDHLWVVRRPNDKRREKTEPFFCENCGQVFSERPDLLEHKNCNADNEGNPSKACTICSMDFPSDFTWLDLKSHIDEIHGKIVLEFCGFCTREFLPNTMRGHSCLGRKEVQTRYKSVARDNIPCDYCENMYRSQQNFERHLQVAHGISRDNKGFNCDICHRSYLSATLVTLHKKTYHKPSDTAEGMSRCELCGAYLKNWRTLSSHLRRQHFNKNNFTCETCGKKFGCPTQMNTHKISHSSESNFVCNICGSKFKMIYGLNRHKRTLHKDDDPVENGVPCPICTSGISFRTPEAVRKHIQRVHVNKMSRTSEWSEQKSSELDSSRVRIDEEDEPGNKIQSSKQKMITRQGGKRLVRTTKEVHAKSESDDNS